MKMATIKISRPSGYYRDFIRKYHILVDGEDRAAIKAGTTSRISVSAGLHIVQARIDWSGSPELQITLSDCEEAKLIVKPAGGVGAFYQAATRTGYLELFETSREAGAT